MKGIARRGVCLVLAAPSGAGKSSLTRALLAAEPELSLSVSVTTRPPRPDEIDGAHYHFRDRAAFDAQVAAGGFLEWATVLGKHSYGTPRAPVETALAAGRDVAFDIDWQGHRQLRAALPGDVVGVFVLPPSLAALEARLRARGRRRYGGDRPAHGSCPGGNQPLGGIRPCRGERFVRRRGGAGARDPARGAVCDGAAVGDGRVCGWAGWVSLGRVWGARSSARKIQRGEGKVRWCFAPCRVTG